jgi:hypothetical protein
MRKFLPMLAIAATLLTSCAKKLHSSHTRASVRSTELRRYDSAGTTVQRLVDTVVTLPADTAVYTFPAPFMPGEVPDSSINDSGKGTVSDYITLADLDNGKSRLQVRYDRRKRSYTTINITKPVAVALKVAETTTISATTATTSLSKHDTISTETVKKTDGGTGFMARINWMLMSLVILGTVLVFGYIKIKKHL